MNLKQYNIEKKNGIALWDEALPIGNGLLGGLLYGTDAVKMALDRIDLWDTRPAELWIDPNFNFDTLIQFVKSGTVKDLNKYLNPKPPYPCKLTAGRLEFTFEKNFVPSFSLSLDQAIATITDENEAVRMKAFTSATEYIGVIQIFGNYKLHYHTPDYICKDLPADGTEAELVMGYPPTEKIQDGEFTYYRQKTHTDFEYGVLILERKLNAYSELYFSIITNTKDSLNTKKNKLSLLANQGFESLLNSHTKWWKDYWSKSEISVGDPFMESLYYRSMYFFGACSRKGFYPMPLQGVWTADSDKLPPWNGDYHYDTNVQLSYQAYLKANHLPEGEVLLDYLWDLKDTFTEYAKTFYHVDGLLIPGVSTIDGRQMGRWPQFGYSPTLTIWTAQSFDEYYLYTEDKTFLQERAYPFFTEVGKAIMGLLKEENGKLYLPLSTSPELHDNRPEAYLMPNSNFDLALMRYLYQTLSKYARLLDDFSAASTWETVLSKLDDLAIDPYNRIMISPNELLNQSHRHLSHLMCLYPLHLIPCTPNNQKIYDRTFFELERLGTGNWVGFSFGMAALIYAMAGQGNGAYRNLYSFAHGFVSDNGFNLNGDFKKYGYSRYHYRPFTLEANFAFCDAIHEMLLQDHEETIRLFPAIPNEWQQNRIFFINLRSRGGVFISAEKAGDTVTYIEIRSPKDRTIQLLNPFASNRLSIITDEKKEAIEIQNGIISITVSKNQKIRIVETQP